MNINELSGHYRGKAVAYALGETQGGNPQVVINFELSEGETKGMRLSYYGYFTDKTQEHTIAAIRACGYTGADLSEITPAQLPNEVDLVIVQEEQQDERGNPAGTRARIRWVNAADRIGLARQMDSVKAKAFAASMKGAMLAQAAGKPKPVQNNAAPPSLRQPNPPPNLDDLPF